MAALSPSAVELDEEEHAVKSKEDQPKDGDKEF